MSTEDSLGIKEEASEASKHFNCKRVEEECEEEFWLQRLKGKEEYASMKKI